MFTLVQKSFKGDMFRLEDSNTKKARWYFLDEKVRNFGKTITEGRKFDIVTEDRDGKSKEGKDIKQPWIVRINTGDTNEVALPSTSTEATSQPYVKKEWKPYSKTPEEQNTIVRQSVGHMASRVVAGLARRDDVKLNEIEALIDGIYNKFLEKVTG